ncbi:MAG: ATP-grasp domain-containing protein [Desulfobacterales bacterium]
MNFSRPKQVFLKYQVPVPQGDVAADPAKAREIAAGMGGFPVAVKAQIHAGGRNQRGGVKLAVPGWGGDRANAIIGMNLVTHQTGPEGRTVKQVLVETKRGILRRVVFEPDPGQRDASVLIIASEAGGMDIEDVAASTHGKNHPR